MIDKINKTPEVFTIKEDRPFVSVIIVNFNGLKFLENCFNSVKKQDYSSNNFEIILIDNASSDGSVEYIKKNHPEILLIEAGKNLGFAAGNNLGFKHAKGTLFALLNNDTEVPTNWISTLVQTMLESNKIGLVTCKILFYAERQTLNSAGLQLLEDGRGYDRGFLEKDVGQFNRKEDVFAACGASVLLRKEMLQEIGTFDDRLFMYYEDLDLAWRARLKNWQCIYTPSTEIYHIHCGSSIAWSDFFTFHVERNRALVCIKNAHLSMAMRCFAIIIVKSLMKILSALFQSIFYKEKIKVAATYSRVLVSLLVNLPAFWISRITIQNQRECTTKNIKELLTPVPQFKGKLDKKLAPELKRCA